MRAFGRSNVSLVALYSSRTRYDLAVLADLLESLMKLQSEEWVAIALAVFIGSQENGAVEQCEQTGLIPVKTNDMHEHVEPIACAAYYYQFPCVARLKPRHRRPSRSLSAIRTDLTIQALHLNRDQQSRYIRLLTPLRL